MDGQKLENVSLTLCILLYFSLYHRVLPRWDTPNAFTSLACASACEFALSTFPTLGGKSKNLFSRFL